MTVHVLLLAGGLGTRLRSVVNDRPKILADVMGRPFITYLLDNLVKSGFDSVTLLTGYMSDVVEERLGWSYEGLRLGYSVETSPLGTGGAIKAAARVIPCQYFLVLNGDTYFDVDFASLIDLATPDHDLIVSRSVDNVGRYGAIRCDSSGLVQDLSEKTQDGPGLINGGIYVLSRDSIASFPGEKFSIETDYFPKRVAARRVYCSSSTAQFIDIGIPSDLARAPAILQ